ncbi:Phosphoserine phosphatase RsbP [Pontiella desulfatans]|uniref:Phosphoserine phosphatase RsbP n=1 Tax=Pontiella desulfatans TaxID=2750659 RepID=A0A6C2UD54_PONDE|nr:SpoIIE family protein phosphatase [Pontiella desulfatans]VGO17351.1 Phosphoserine phosphatase RsbP [Pontiella desulfatans]
MDLRDKDYLLLKNLMDNMTDSIYFKDLESRFVMVNRASARWQGFEQPDDAIGTSDFDTYQEEDARRMFADEQRIIETGIPLVGLEEEETSKNGQVAWVSTTKMPLRDDDGRIVGTFGISRDITEHKQAELSAARYAEQVRLIKEEMEDDVRMAAELQKTFFPNTYPSFPAGCAPADSRVGFLHRYHPSGMVSGDFCSIRRLSETKCGVLQCDVMGHGVRAALVTALICAIVEELSQQEHDPGAYLARMNELLLPTLRRDDSFLYATACYLVFDTATGLLRHANAGHPVPLLFQGAAAEWLMEDAALRGPALAVCEGTEFLTLEKQLAPGDSVVMYTDGLYEVEGANGEEFGEQRLADSARRHARLPLRELFPALIGDARRFAGANAFDDDICLVGLECRALQEEKD